MSTERYNRQIILRGFGEEAQQKLRNAKVLVVGAGGLGCPALQYLVASGIGSIGLVDGDVVCLSNLHRQILFGTSDIGRLKVDVAAESLSRLNSGVEIKPYPFFLNRQNILGLFKAYDYILDGTDNFVTRYLINDACALLSKPLIFAAVSGYEGQLAIFNITDSQGCKTNYRDLFPIPPGRTEIPNCSENGVLGVLCGIIGTMQAAEVIKLITGTGKALINKILTYSLETRQLYEISISADPAHTYSIPENESGFLKTDDSILESMDADYLEIDAAELEKLRSGNSTVILDLRENDEMPRLDPSKYKHIPMSAFEDFLESEIEEENIVLICQHGIRSLAAAESLQEKYGVEKKIYNLKGGIVRWKEFFK